MLLNYYKSINICKRNLLHGFVLFPVFQYLNMQSIFQIYFFMPLTKMDIKGFFQQKISDVTFIMITSLTVTALMFLTKN